MDNFQTPVLFLIFNRPGQTRAVFEEIRKARPKQLFIAADGPRAHVPADRENCAQTRAVVQLVDWDCEVKTLFREQNLGCGHAVSDAITWFFNQVDLGIILEDDCLPDPTFFGYCQDVLNRYRNDERIMMVSGTNLVERWETPGRQDYFFSYYGGIWGWASWRRAWKKYDFGMTEWKNSRSRDAIRDVLNDEEHAEERIKLFDAVAQGKIDTWDYQWGFCRLINSGLSVVPRVNLISNIGFGADATHTTADSSLANISRHTLTLPLKENPITVVDRKYDDQFFRHGKGPAPALWKRAIRKIYK